MDSANWALALLNSAAFLLCLVFLVYVLCIVRPYLHRDEIVPGLSESFSWHLVVPCLNEEDVIADTALALARDFPYATVWCVDDGSDDETPHVLALLQATVPSLRVVSRQLPEARQGKGPALNAAWSQIVATLPEDVDPSQVIVGVVDADGRLDRYCPDCISGADLFGNPEVGAVQVQVRVLTDVDLLATTDTRELAARLGKHPVNRRSSLLVQLQDMEFSGPIAAMQTLRRRTGSVGMGGNGQFTRLSALNRVAIEYGTPWQGALLEDFELGLHVLLCGYRTEYADDTFVAQTGLTQVRPLIRQRSRWSQGGMQCLRYLPRVMSSPDVALPTALEIAYYLYIPWSQLVGSIVFPLAIGIDAWYLLHTAGGLGQWWVAGAWGLAPLAVLFGILPHVIWGPLYRLRTGCVFSFRKAVGLGLANIGYGYLLQVSTWWAFVRLVRRRRDWKKTVHTQPLSNHGTLEPRELQESAA